jgi:HEAT repeat protein
MATSQPQREDIARSLASADWSVALRAIADAISWVEAASPGQLGTAELSAAIASLAGHEKWEVRRAVALAAARNHHGAYDAAIERLTRDENARVRQAASQTALRRRDSRNAGAFGKQHEDRVNRALDDIEGRYGVRGREAVKRAAEDIANTFAREVYHEVITRSSGW